VHRSLSVQHTAFTTDRHHAPGGIRTPNPSRRAAADLRLRPCGHRKGRRCVPSKYLCNSTPTTTQETSNRERGNYVREMSGEFCRQIASSTIFEGIFYMPQIWDMGPTALLPFRRKACWGFFHPRTWVPKASMLTPRPPKPLYGFRLLLTLIFNSTRFSVLKFLHMRDSNDAADFHYPLSPHATLNKAVQMYILNVSV
jgi:hypothetical protein